MATLRLGIWKKTSTAKSLAVMEGNIRAYMDETTKPESAKYPNMTVSVVGGTKDEEWLKSGIDYLTKEEKGRLKVFGFLRDDILAQTGEYPNRLDNNKRAIAAAEAWKLRLRDKGRREGRELQKVAHKFVLALNPKFCDQLVKAGKSADDVLTSVSRTLMRRYQEKYYPGEEISFIVGIHHDKKHIHAHLMVYPTTKAGQLLRVSDEGRSRGARKPYTYLREMAHKLLQQYYDKELFKPAKASKRPIEVKYQPRLLAFLAYKRVKEGNPGVEAINIRAVDDTRNSLENLSDTDLRQQLLLGYQGEKDRYAVLRKQFIRNPASAQEYLAQRQAELTVVKQEYTAKLAEFKKALEQTRKDNAIHASEYHEFITQWKAYRSQRINSPLNDNFDFIVAQKDKLVKDVAFRRIIEAQVAADALKVHKRVALTSPATYNSQIHSSMFSDLSGSLGPAMGFLAATAPRGCSDYVMEYFKQLEAHDKKRRLEDTQAKKERLQALEALRTWMDVKEINVAMTNAAIRGTEPSYLAQWGALGDGIPLAARRKSKQEAIDAERGANAEPTNVSDDLVRARERAIQRARESRLDVEGEYDITNKLQIKPEDRVMEELKRNESIVRKMFKNETHTTYALRLY